MSLPALKSDNSFGERLRLKREKRKLSVEKVAEKLKVKAALVKALENEDLSSLPAKTYTRGILNKYCELLRLPAKKSLKDLEKIYGLRDKPRRSPLAKETFFKKRKHRLVDLCAARKWAALIVFSLVLLYLLSKANAIFGKPEIAVNYPQDNLIVSTDDIFAEGRIDGVFKNFSINGQRVAVSGQGGFKEEIFLKPGENEIVFSATNFFNKTSEVRRKIINRK